jgi:hypothetical protein
LIPERINSFKTKKGLFFGNKIKFICFVNVKLDAGTFWSEASL